MKRIALCIAAALLVASTMLVACAGGSSSQDADPKETWIGVWELSELNDGKTSVSADDVAHLKEIGLVVSLDLKADGTSLLVLYGISSSGTWSASSESTATMTMEDHVIDLSKEKDTIRMTYDGETLVFMQPSDK